MKFEDIILFHDNITFAVIVSTVKYLLKILFKINISVENWSVDLNNIFHIAGKCNGTLIMIR